MTETGTAPTVALAEVADQLIADLPRHAAGRAARTVLSGPVMRAVVIALAQGTELAEHDAPRAATLHCIIGELTLRSGDDTWLVPPGALVPIPPARHSVEAHTDAAFLLTVALGQAPTDVP